LAKNYAKAAVTNTRGDRKLWTASSPAFTRTPKNFSSGFGFSRRSAIETSKPRPAACRLLLPAKLSHKGQSNLSSPQNFVRSKTNPAVFGQCPTSMTSPIGLAEKQMSGRQPYDHGTILNAQLFTRRGDRKLDTVNFDSY